MSNHGHLISGKGVLLLLLGITAWSSNPDDASFRRFAARQASENTGGVVEHVATRLLTQVALDVGDWEYIDYGFFSTVVFPDSNVTYVGAFGYWNRVGEQKSKPPE